MPIHAPQTTPFLVALLTLITGGCAPPDAPTQEPTDSTTALIEEAVQPAD